MEPQQARIPITQRALYQRINRALKQEGKKLCTARSRSVELAVGRYFIVNVNHNFIDSQHVDLEALACELDVLRPWEKVTE